MNKIILTAFLFLSTHLNAAPLTHQELDGMTLDQLEHKAKDPAALHIDRVGACARLIHEDTKNQEAIQVLLNISAIPHSNQSKYKALKNLAKNETALSQHKDTIKSRLESLESESFFGACATSLLLTIDPTQKQKYEEKLKDLLGRSDPQIQYKAIVGLTKELAPAHKDKHVALIPRLKKLLDREPNDGLRVKILCEIIRLSQFYKTEHVKDYAPVLKNQKVQKLDDTARYKALTCLKTLWTEKADLSKWVDEVLAFSKSNARPKHVLGLVTLAWNDMAPYKKQTAEALLWKVTEGRNRAVQLKALAFLQKAGLTNNTIQKSTAEFFTMARASKHEADRFSALSLLWQNRQVRETQHDELLALHLDLIERGSNLEAKTNAIKYLYECLPEGNARDRLTAVMIEIMKKPCSTGVKSTCIDLVCYQPAKKEEHINFFRDLLLKEAGAPQNEGNISSFALQKLWEYPEISQGLFNRLVTINCNRILVTQDADEANLLLSQLFKDPQSVTQHSKLLTDSVMKIAKTHASEQIKEQARNFLWSTPAIVALSQDELKQLEIQFINTTQNAPHQEMSLKRLINFNLTDNLSVIRLILDYAIKANSEDSEYWPPVWHHDRIKRECGLKIIQAYAELIKVSRDPIALFDKVLGDKIFRQLFWSSIVNIFNPMTQVHQPNRQLARHIAICIWKAVSHEGNHFDHLFQSYLRIILEGQGTIACLVDLTSLFKEEKLKVDQRATVCDLLVRHLKTVKDEIACYHALSAMFRDKKTREKHNHFLVTELFSLVGTSRDTAAKPTALDLLWGDAEVMRDNFDRLLDLKLAELATYHYESILSAFEQLIQHPQLTTEMRIKKVTDAVLARISVEKNQNVVAKLKIMLLTQHRTCAAGMVYFDDVLKLESPGNSTSFYQDLLKALSVKNNDAGKVVVGYISFIKRCIGNENTNTCLNHYKELIQKSPHFSNYRDTIVAGLVDLVQGNDEGNDEPKKKLFDFVVGQKDFQDNLPDNLYAVMLKVAKKSAKLALNREFLKHIKRTDFSDIFDVIMPYLIENSCIDWMIFIFNHPHINDNQRLKVADSLLNKMDKYKPLINFNSAQLILSHPATASQYKAKLEEAYEKIIIALTSPPNIVDPNKEGHKINHLLDAYYLFGDSFKDQFDHFITDYLPRINDQFSNEIINAKAKLYGEEHDIIQTMLYVRALNGHSGNLFRDLLDKTKAVFEHNPSLVRITCNGVNLDFKLADKVFAYQPLTQTPLASLEDVRALLGEQSNQEVTHVLNNQTFKNFFTAPFSDDAMMMQALVQKYKHMDPLTGPSKMLELIFRLTTCGPAKNQEILKYYKEESKPIPMATLKDITTILLMLRKQNLFTEAEILENFKKSRDDLVIYIQNYMLGQGHIFRRHLTDLRTDEAAYLKALLGPSVLALVDMEQTAESRKLALVNALNMILSFGDPEHFFANLDRLWKAHGLILPANRYGGLVSVEDVDPLINKLTPAMAEGRGEARELQHKMRNFMARHDVETLLKSSEEAGYQLRELIHGFIDNNWPVGLLSLAEAASEKDVSLVTAVNSTYAHTRIDGDVTLTMVSITKVLMREIQRVREGAFNQLLASDNPSGDNEPSHSLAYIKALLGGAVGLRPADKQPPFDLFMHHTAKTTQARQLQTSLDDFHIFCSARHVVDHLAALLREKKLSLVDPKDGENLIWLHLNQVAKAELNVHHIELDVDLDELLIGDNKVEVTRLCLALLLCKLGLFELVTEG